MSQVLIFSLVILGLVFWVLRSMKFAQIKEQMPKYLEEGALILDVRTAEEYQGEHALKSMNIPLHLLQEQVHRLPRDRKIVVCCASGSRSKMAERILRSLGYQDVVNAGPWRNTK